MRSLITKYGGHPLRFLRTFLDNRRVFLTNGKPKRGPLGAVFNMSTRCDARCLFCDYWKEAVPARTELGRQDKLKIIKDLSNAGVWLISFCSAEPLLSEDLDAAVSEAKKGGMLVNISTNGSWLEERAGMLVRLGVDNITVSMDSHQSSVHDELRGYPGLFERAERGITRIRSLRKGKRRPWMTVRHLVNAKTYFAIEEFLGYWSGKADEVVLKPVFASADGMFRVPADMRPRPDDEAAFREYFTKVLRKFPRIDNEYHRALPDQLFGKGRGPWRCFAGTFFTDIDHEGNVRPCTEYGLKSGNMLRNDFLDIWASEDMREFRGKIKDAKKCPGCWGDKFASAIRVQKALDLLGGI